MHFSPLFIAAFASATLAAPIRRDTISEHDAQEASFSHEHDFTKTTTPVTIAHHPEHSWHGDSAVNSNILINDRRGFGFGPQQSAQSKQSGSADAHGGSSAQFQTNRPVLSGAGNSLTTGGEQVGNNGAYGGQVGQSAAQGTQNRQQSAYGAQQGSADAHGGLSKQLESNSPVLSGAGNSLTSGGAQGADNSGHGGSVGQSLGQGFGQKRGFGFGGQSAQSKQSGSADATGGSAFQLQSNRPVVSGAGNSVTTGGAQQADDSAHGGSVGQGATQGFGGYRRQFAAGKQGASADAFGGSSFQAQSNRPVVSGFGNSVTAGGAQGADNSAQGGQTKQSLSQKFGQRDNVQGQSSVQVASADAVGGDAVSNSDDDAAWVHHPDAYHNQDSSAHAGKINQVAINGQSGSDDDAQVNKTKNVENNEYTKNVHNSKNYDQDVHYEKNLNNDINSNSVNRRLIGNLPVASFDGSANQQGGFGKRLIGNVPVASFDGSANQQGGFGKRLIGNLPLASYDGSANQQGGFGKRLIGNVPVASFDGSANKQFGSLGKRLIGNLPVASFDGSANKQFGGSKRQFSSQQANGDSYGGASDDVQVNEPYVQGNGLSKTFGGVQQASGAAVGKQISQSA